MEAIGMTIGIVYEDGAKGEMLGGLVMMMVPDLRVKVEQARIAIEKAGASEVLVVFDIKEHDAFRRATMSVNGTDIKINGFRAEVLVRNFSTDRGEIKRFMVREVRDKDAGVPEFRNVAEIRFVRETKEMKILELEPGNSEFDYNHLYLEMREAYEEYKQYLVGDSIRRSIRKGLHRIDSVLIRDGVYFVKKDRLGDLAALEDAVKMIEGIAEGMGKRLDFKHFQVVGGGDEKKWLGERVDDRLGEEVGYLVEEIRSRKGRGLSASVASKYVEQAKDMTRKIGEYERYLETEMEKTKIKAQMVEKEAIRLLEQVKAEKVK